MNILIIGGRSSLGTELLRSFRDDHKVSTAGRSGCNHYLDLSNPEALFEFPADLDVIIHCAASFGGNSDEEISQAELVNVMGTLKILQMANSAKVKHVIYISSIFSQLRSDSPFHSIYSITKKHSEELAEFYCSLNSLNLTILRPSQLYGGKNFAKHQPFFHHILTQAKLGNDIYIYGSKAPLRNYLYIKDLVEVIRLVAENTLTGSFCCNSPKNTTYQEIAEIAYSVFNTHGKVRYVKDRNNIPDNGFSEDDTLFSLINYHPRYTISDGIKDLISLNLM